MTTQELSDEMKNIKEKKYKNCKGRGFVPMGEGMKGLTQCPVCLAKIIFLKNTIKANKAFEKYLIDKE